MANFTYIDLILFLGVSQGLFLAVSLRLIANRNKAANNILSALLLCAVLMLFGRVVVYRIPENWVWRFGILVDTTIFLFGPLIYMYVRRLLFAETPPFRLQWLHFIPAGLHLCYYFWTLSFPLSNFNEMYAGGSLNLMFFLVEALGLLFFIYYFIRSVGLLVVYAGQEEKVLSFNQSVLHYLKFVLGTIMLLLSLWSFSFLSAHLGTPLRYLNYETMWVCTPLFIYIIAYFSLRQPEIFRIPLEKKSSTDNDRLKPEEIQKLQKRLHFFMAEEKVYIKSNITLKALADKLNTSTNNLSWLLNQVYQTTFYDYINRHRIQEFLGKIDKGEHTSHTLLALAMDVGFNSKSTFNKAFKNETGVTPSSYIKNKNVA